MQADLCDAKAGRDGGEGRHRRQYWFHVGQMDLDPLHDLGEGEVSHSVIGDDVHQHSGLLKGECPSSRESTHVAVVKHSDAIVPNPEHEKELGILRFHVGGVHPGLRCDER
jgi:hypothetical protein